MNHKLVDLLERAKSLISDPQVWVQDKWATDLRGKEVDPTAWGATCWCVTGALMREASADLDNFSEVYGRAVRLFPTDFHGSVPGWNDNPNTTHADVMAAFDVAIEKAKQV